MPWVFSTVKPANGAETPEDAVTVTVRVPGAASEAMAIVTGRLVAVPPAAIVPVTPVPEKVTAVAPVRLTPVIVDETEAL